jgi:hypothetical protein
MVQRNSVDRGFRWARLACGLYVLLVAMDRNNQGEYIDQATGALDYHHYALQTFVVWFVASAIVTATSLSILVAFILALTRWLFRRSA